MPFFATYDTPYYHFNRITNYHCQLKIASIFVFRGDTIISFCIHVSINSTTIFGSPTPWVFCISKTTYLEEYGFLYKQSLFSMSARPRLDAKPHPQEIGIDCIENNRKTHCITTHYIKWGG
nr:MAG TPA: hypothetical protein [Caudoviricetes sp.]